MIGESKSTLDVTQVGRHSSVFVFTAKAKWHPHIKTWCGLPYNGKKGCPNYGKNSKCPPCNKNIDEIIDINEDVYVFGLSFNLKLHADKMKEKHPTWAERQCYNVIYWQPTEKKKFKVLVNSFKEKYPDLVIDTLPEGHGVNITRMLKDAGVDISWKYPMDKVWRVAIAGKKAKATRKKKVKNV